MVDMDFIYIAISQLEFLTNHDNIITIDNCIESGWVGSILVNVVLCIKICVASKVL